MKIFFRGITPQQIFTELFKAFYVGENKYMSAEIEQAGKHNKGFVMYYDRSFHPDNFPSNWIAIDKRGIIPPNNLAMFFNAPINTKKHVKATIICPYMAQIHEIGMPVNSIAWNFPEEHKELHNFIWKTGQGNIITVMVSDDKNGSVLTIQSPMYTNEMVSVRLVSNILYKLRHIINELLPEKTSGTYQGQPRFLTNKTF